MDMRDEQYIDITLCVNHKLLLVLLLVLQICLVYEKDNNDRRYEYTVQISRWGNGNTMVMYNMGMMKKKMR